MAINNMPRKHRHRRHYTIMFISGDSDANNKRIHLNYVQTQLLAFTAFAIVLAIICYVIYSSMTLYSMRNYEKVQSATIKELNDNNAALEAENSELNKKIEQLSYTLNEKVQTEAQLAEEAEANSLPTGYPLTGTAAMESTFDDPNSTNIATTLTQDATQTEDDTDDTEEDADDTGDNDAAVEASSEADTSAQNPIVIFKGEQGSNIVATGNGTVLSVTADSKYGTCITIDHGDGYYSIYRNKGDSLVNEGDTVIRGSILFIINEENTLLGYQIKEGEEYIDPETMIDISG
ncbi:MAG: M23 family metallopeptidase [Butyrivibrio sp.]|nr:M23 family metallopeptidase [Butyrivibrio sp.]